jgi:tryptophanyl-tRNA synthetase
MFYRQSDIREIPELTWMLNCVCGKGLMNRAHAYKGAVDANVESGEDADKAITMGLFSYPVLMAADIVMFGANKVPVGKDQIQHVEMARDMAQRFNHIYASKKQPILTIPEYEVDEEGAILQGLDGRKMSKSYGNTIPLFLTEKKLQKHINKIQTNLLEPGEAKDPDDSTVFQIWNAFANPEQVTEMRQAFADGIGWGDAKKRLCALINEEIGEARERYNELLTRPQDIEEELQKGAAKARIQSQRMMDTVRQAVGIYGLK